MNNKTMKYIKNYNIYNYDKLKYIFNITLKYLKINHI